jgi:hypothetical protein
MIRALTIIVPALLLASCGPGSNSSVAHTNASTTAELNAIAANTSETAGANADQGELTGDQYRSGAATPPSARAAHRVR